MKVYASCLLAVNLVATECSSNGDSATTEGLPHRDMYEAVQASALLFSCTDGDWAEFGDAALRTWTGYSTLLPPPPHLGRAGW